PATRPTRAFWGPNGSSMRRDGTYPWAVDEPTLVRTPVFSPATPAPPPVFSPMIRVPALIPLLVWATFTFPVHAQNPTGTSGGARLDPTEQVDGPVFVEGDAAVVTSDTLNERILYLASGQAWALDLHTGRWQHLQPLRLPEGVTEGAY